MPPTQAGSAEGGRPAEDIKLDSLAAGRAAAEAGSVLKTDDPPSLQLCRMAQGLGRGGSSTTPSLGLHQGNPKRRWAADPQGWP